MPAGNLDVIDRIGRTLAVAILVYLTTFVLLIGIGSVGGSINPLFAILLGLFTVYVGVSLYYYRNPSGIAQ